MALGILHGAARVALRPPSCRAQHLCDEILESCRWHLVVRLVRERIGIQSGRSNYLAGEWFRLAAATLASLSIRLRRHAVKLAMAAAISPGTISNAQTRLDELPPLEA
jgi:hypothetical protein